MSFSGILATLTRERFWPARPLSTRPTADCEPRSRANCPPLSTRRPVAPSTDVVLLRPNAVHESAPNPAWWTDGSWLAITPNRSGKCLYRRRQPPEPALSLLLVAAGLALIETGKTPL